MKKSLSMVIIVMALAAQVHAANENVVVWERIYQESRTNDQRIAVMLRIMDFKDKAFSPVITRALETLAATKLNLGTMTEITGKVELAKLLIRELGDLKASEGAEAVFSVYKETKDVFLKSEAAIALGKMRALDYVDHIARDLADLNQPPLADQKREREILALNLVQALGIMRSPIGFEPVFIAGADGWYSAGSKVKETARAVTLTMVDDPTENILSLIEKHPSIEVKTKALEAAIGSKAPQDAKNKVAYRALVLGIERVTTDLAGQLAVRELRTKALDGLIRNRDRNPDRVPYMVTLIDMDKNNDLTKDETLKAYLALGHNGSDEAAKALAAKLTFYNERQSKGALPAREKEFVRQIVNSMGLSKNALVKNALTQASLNDSFDRSIVREMEAVLKALP